MNGVPAPKLSRDRNTGAEGSVLGGDGAEMFGRPRSLLLPDRDVCQGDSRVYGDVAC